MALSVKHAFQTLLPDDPTKDVSANEWNQDHTLTGVLGVANGGTGTTTGAPGVLVSDTPPAGAPDNSLWWESDSGLLYLRYNDGTSTQWVLAAPQPDISMLATATYVDAADTVLTNTKVAKAGDTMSGHLSLPTGPAASNAVRKDYVDAGDAAVTTAYQAADTTLTNSVNSRVAKAGDTMTGDLTPAVNGAVNLGSATLRWGTVFTSDLDLNNGIGDWTIVEGEEDLFLYNNKKGRTYKFALVEVDTAPPKKV